MAAKGNGGDKSFTHQPKRPRSGFKVGPQNLPDGSWRRKVIKIKKELIHQAKVKKTFAKIKLQVPAINTPVQAAEPGIARLLLSKPSQEIQPDRQTMLDAPTECIPPDQQKLQLERKRRRKPPYFGKETAFAEERKAEVQVRKVELERRNKERHEKIVQRETFRRSMSKARTGGRNGQRKLGRESTILLERVKRIVES